MRYCTKINQNFQSVRQKQHIKIKLKPNEFVDIALKQIKLREK